MRPSLFGLWLLLSAMTLNANGTPRLRTARWSRGAGSPAGSAIVAERTYHLDIATDSTMPGGLQAGVVYVPDGVFPRARYRIGEVDRWVPIVVFLHGANEGGVPDLWFREDGPRPDLRTLADRMIRDGNVEPFIIAAPSNANGAWSGRSLWQDFSLADLLHRAEAVLPPGLHIDRTRIIVFGHSGAGCNPRGGLLQVAAEADSPVRPFAIIAIDTCLNREGARILARTDPATHVIVYWQTRTWARDFSGYRKQFQLAWQEQSPSGLRRIEPISVTENDPHNAIVGQAIARALGKLIARGRGSGLTPRDAETTPRTRGQR